MTITPTKITRAAGVAAALSGLIFIGVQVKHPHMDIRSITTNDVLVRDSLKLLMAALALAGITGMYARQVTKMGVLGLIGFVLFTAGYLGIACTAFVAAFVLPVVFLLLVLLVLLFLSTPPPVFSPWRSPRWRPTAETCMCQKLNRFNTNG